MEHTRGVRPHAMGRGVNALGRALHLPLPPVNGPVEADREETARGGLSPVEAEREQEESIRLAWHKRRQVVENPLRQSLGEGDAVSRRQVDANVPFGGRELTTIKDGITFSHVRLLLTRYCQVRPPSRTAHELRQI